MGLAPVFWGRSHSPRTLNVSISGLEFIFQLEAGTGTGKSERIHFPGGDSGVTLGPGYDMRERRAADVERDLTVIGVDPAIAKKLSNGVKLHGELQVTPFVNAHKHDLKLSVAQQKQLLKIVTPTPSDELMTGTGGVMNAKILWWPLTRIVLWPALVVALLSAPALADKAAPAGQPLPQKLLGIWRITGVLSDAGSWYRHKFEPDDPRLMGGILFISPQSMIAKADGEMPSSKNPTVTLQTITAGQLLKDTMDEHPEPPAHPTTRDFGLPFDQNEQLSVMWVKDFGCWDELDFNGTWMFEMPDGRLAMLWRNSAIILLSRAPADIPPPASFDCTKAHTPVEKTICGSVALSLLDSNVAAWYESTSGSLSSRAWGEQDRRYLDAMTHYKSEQKAWLKQRDACGSNAECLKKSMDARIAAMSAYVFPQYGHEPWVDDPAPVPDTVPAGKPLPETLPGVWQVTGVLTDAGSHWVCDYVNNDPRLMGGVVLISSQRIWARAGGETVTCINPTIITQNIAAGRLIKESMNARNVDPPEYPTPGDFGFPFEPNTQLSVMWIKDFDGYWQALTTKGTWLLPMADGRLAMRWRYAAILLLSRIPATTTPADTRQMIASFDCAKAQTPANKAICGSLELSFLDSYVSEWYEGCIAILPEKARALHVETFLDDMKLLKKEQKAWLKQRETCGTDPACLKKSLNARADALASKYSKLSPVLSYKE
jgi:uncharacterized protein